MSKWIDGNLKIMLKQILICLHGPKTQNYGYYGSDVLLVL